LIRRNQNAIGGSISPDTFQDASSLLDVIESSDATWHEWPLTATDGDCATLLQLVSENKVRTSGIVSTLGADFCDPFQGRVQG